MAVTPARARPVLIGFAEALAAPEVAWSLLDAGARVVAFTRAGSRPPLRRCKGVEIEEIAAPEDDVAQARADLLELIGAREHLALMPLDDASLWLCDAIAGEHPVAVVGPLGEPARLALDKRLQLRAASRAGLSVPPSAVVGSVPELMALDRLPVQLKPAQPVFERDGRLVRGGNHICGTPEELASSARAWNGAYPLIAQPLLSGVGEGLFGLAGPDGVHAWSAHRRVRMMNPHGSGSSACESAPVDPGLAAAAARMLAEAGWTGMFMLEFLRGHDGTPWFIELNGRAWGSMALARRCGLEYPAWALEGVVDPGFVVPEARGAEGVRCRHLGRELVHLLMVLRGPRSEAIDGWPSRWRTAGDVFRVRRRDDWYNWRPGAAGLFIEDTIGTVAHHLPRRIAPWRGSAR
jgi:predicted ATP-grasp superfamily ATP-dependent carboligase